jgi:hypothetical protein
VQAKRRGKFLERKKKEEKDGVREKRESNLLTGRKRERKGE